MFSDDEGSSDASSSRKGGSSSKHHRLAGSHGKSTSSKLKNPSSDNLSAKEKLKLEFDPSALRSLNENKKDVRTIEEIEQDIRKKHALAQPPVTAPATHGLFTSRKTATVSTNPSSSQAFSSGTNAPAKSNVASTSESSRKPTESSRGKARSSPEEDPKRRRTTSPVDLKAARSQTSRHASPPLPRKQSRDASPPSSPPPGKLSKAEARRREIWAILNPHKAHLANYGPAYNDDDFSDEDMEAGIEDIEEEDRRAARIARMEDKAEEERLKQKAKEKAAKKSGK